MPESVVEPNLSGSWEPIVHISFQLYIQCYYLSSLESTTVEVFAPWKLANTTSQSFFFLSPVSQFTSIPCRRQVRVRFQRAFGQQGLVIFYLLFVVGLQKNSLNLPDLRKTCFLEIKKLRI